MKNQCVEIHSGRKYLTKKFPPLTSTGEIGENFLLAKFLLYTVYFKQLVARNSML